MKLFIRYNLYVILYVILFSCAGIPPNKPVCFRDSPLGGKCDFMEAGNDFRVDNTGKNNYTQDGHNWTFDQLVAHSLIMPPETYGEIKKFFLNYCHANANLCSYSTAVAQFTKFEVQHHWTKFVPTWTDKMLSEEVSK